MPQIVWNVPLTIAQAQAAATTGILQINPAVQLKIIIPTTGTPDGWLYICVTDGGDVGQTPCFRQLGANATATIPGAPANPYTDGIYATDAGKLNIILANKSGVGDPSAGYALLLDTQTSNSIMFWFYQVIKLYGAADSNIHNMWNNYVLALYLNNMGVPISNYLTRWSVVVNGSSIYAYAFLSSLRWPAYIIGSTDNVSATNTAAGITMNCYALPQAPA